MCPDNQILSVYFDGELPSPWKEKLAAHLGSCPQCRARLEQFGRCSQALISAPQMPDTEASKERVWQKIQPLNMRKPKPPRLWGRTIAVPLPAAVAAAAGICAVLFLAVLKQPPAAAPPAQDAVTASSGMTDVQGIVPVSNMNDVLQYLGNQDTADIVIIRLPESRSFSHSGEPTIIKASDYARRAVTP